LPNLFRQVEASRVDVDEGELSLVEPIHCEDVGYELAGEHRAARFDERDFWTQATI
jgi:hypothetical protein